MMRIARQTLHVRKGAYDTDQLTRSWRRWGGCRAAARRSSWCRTTCPPTTATPLPVALRQPRRAAATAGAPSLLADQLPRPPATTVVIPECPSMGDFMGHAVLQCYGASMGVPPHAGFRDTGLLVWIVPQSGPAGPPALQMILALTSTEIS